MSRLAELSGQQNEDRTSDFDNAAWPLLIFESGPTPMCFDRFKLRL